jgi:hypothetical protein
MTGVTISRQIALSLVATFEEGDIMLQHALEIIIPVPRGLTASLQHHVTERYHGTSYLG